MRGTRSRARERDGEEADRGLPGGSPRMGWGLGLAAAALVLGVLVVVRRIVDPSLPLARSYQVLQLLLLIAAGVARALGGFRPGLRRAAEKWRLPTAGIAAAVVLGAVLPYLHTLTIGFLSDDFGLAYAARQAPAALDALRSNAFVTFRRPATLFLWWLGGNMWQGAPLGYHALNLLLHAANSLLVYALGRRLLNSAYGGLLAALLFALHPLHVEPVAWASCSSDLLCTAFCLVSLLSLEAYAASTTPRRGGVALLGALAAFAMALLSKEAALALPGFVLLRLALLPPPRARLRTAVAVGAFGLVLGTYLMWRVLSMGGLPTYPTTLTFWNTVFPSAPLRQMGDFLFPVHRPLFLRALGLWLWCAAMLPMAAAVLWVIAGLTYVPGRRLWLWLGYVFIMAIPVWTISAATSGDLSGGRFAYLPTIGLAWLFGDVCAGRGTAWRGLAPAGGILLGAAVLSIWYVAPWRQAGRLATEVLTAGTGVVERVSASGEPSALYFCDLPESVDGAPIFRNCYPQALSLAAGSPIAAHTVSGRDEPGTIHPDDVSARILHPGEYVVSWRPETARMVIVRSGDGPPARHPESPR